MSFTAKAEKARNLGIGAGWLGGAPDYAFTDYYGNSVALTTTDADFSFDFEITKPGYSNSRISFNMGNFGGTDDGFNKITISNVSLKNMGPAK